MSKRFVVGACAARPAASLPFPQREIAQPQVWPELMRAQTAARYVDEPSVRAFRKRVGKVYPKGTRIPGRGDVWRKMELDSTIAALPGSAATILDAADVL
jgi:hypothetical protein